MNELYYKNLTDKQKDEVILLLLNELGYKIVDSAQWGKPIIRLKLEQQHED